MEYIYDHKKRIKAIIIFTTALLAVAGAVFGITRLASRGNNDEIQSAYREYTAAKGSITVGTSENGTASIGRSYITFPASAEIEEVYVRVGTEVNEGDKLAKLNIDDVEDFKSQYEKKIQTAKLELEAALSEKEIRLAEAENSYSSDSETEDKSVSNTTSSVEKAVESASLLASGKSLVSGGELEDETEYTTAGVQPEYMQISNLEIQYGDFFNEYDIEDNSKVAVLGYKTAQEIFGSAYLAAGEIVTIEGKNYEVIGVLASMGTVSSGLSPDEAVFLPYSTAKKYVFGNDISPQITVVADDVDEVENVIANIEILLSENYPNASFTLTDAGSKMEAATSSANTLSMLLIAVAAIVFVVGGIGIMNVLFVTVKERTQEIGLLKALGCRKREILLTFLIEANLISLFGGIVGVVAGFVLIPAVELSGMRCEPVISGGVLALIFAVITGTIFGFYPAFKASQLTPIEALSQD